jgi:transcriptional regulator with XRE-family HTH domain
MTDDRSQAPRDHALPPAEGGAGAQSAPKRGTGRAAAGAPDLARELGRRARAMRKAAGLTLEALAARSGVSRAMLSKVERGEKSPTLSVATRIAGGLDVSLSALMGADPLPAGVAVRRAGERPCFRDPETGFERHVLSPANAGGDVELILHVIPPGVSSGVLPTYEGGVEKYLIVQEGRLSVYLGTVRHELDVGDSFFFRITEPYRFVNEGAQRCSYYCLIVSRP